MSQFQGLPCRSQLFLANHFCFPPQLGPHIIPGNESSQEKRGNGACSRSEFMLHDASAHIFIGSRAMKRILILTALAAICLGCASSPPEVLLFMRPGSGDLEYMLQHEVMVMKDTLEQSGCRVVVATLDGNGFSAGSMKVDADIKLADAKVADYAGFMLPCLMVPSYPMPDISEEALTMVRDAVAAGKPVAAQTGSLWTLAKAGVLEGRKYAYAFEENHEYFKGATFGGTGVVTDGPVLTSGLCPHMARTMGTGDGTKELALALAEAIKKQ